MAAEAAPLLQVRGLGKIRDDGHRQRVILQDLSLQLHAGEIVAILGPSGCGKTTLLNLIAGLDDADSGSIRLKGRELRNLPETDRAAVRRRDMGFVFQLFNLIPTLTIAENCALPLELNGRDEDIDLIPELLQEAGLSDCSRQLPERLSGGEQQRAALIRALVHRPSLVLADEPTGNLDEDTGEQIAELLFRQLRDTGSSALLVTHSLALAARADRILRLEHGQLHPVPTPSEHQPRTRSPGWLRNPH